MKLGCVLSQTTVDKDGHPVRDADSSTYVSTFEPVQDFGSLLYAGPMRRGVESARQLIIIGDGAAWIWNLAAEQFPRAVEIVDLYQAREHLFNLGRLVMPTVNEKRWFASRLGELDRGDIESLLAAFNALPESKPDEVHTALAYFENNQERMRYGRFRGLGLFIGSVTVEAADVRRSFTSGSSS